MKSSYSFDDRGTDRQTESISECSLKGDRPLFLPILVIIILFFFMGEKVSSGIWETCPKILGGYEYQNPPKWGLIYRPIYIYIYNCMYHIIIVIISKNKS